MPGSVWSSDDRSASHRYVWHGPADFPLWDWHFTQWGVFVAAFIALQTFLAVLAPGFWFGVALAVTNTAVAFVIGGPLTRKAMKTETGLAYQIRTLEAETRAPRPTDEPDVLTAIPAALFAEPTQQVTTALPAVLLPPPRRRTP